MWPLPPVLAHRCGGALAPENTLAGLDVAAACGCRGVEFDVMLSADGLPLLIHDETLERTTNGHGRVSAQALAQLRRLDAGSWFDRQFTGERLPALEDALARCTALGLAVNLELKPAAGFDRMTGQVVADRLVAGIRRDLPGLVISSFSSAALNAAMAVLPDACYGWLVDALPHDWADRAAALGVQAIHTNSAYLSPARCAAVRERGYHLAIYTENDPVRAKAMLDAGVETVITDFPDKVRQIDMSLV
ncbi:glycerophosphodiester phosphodiesterase [Azoarcus sp. L1K30]|uniref:glycerophosphodiester phosphodiesterase n=1 Tax=Azoarcus sp. L1K30 TaxID=2820277 RepID=UPI001B810F32|nr:glycerophosphodiester phosphodiesterase [Azoarcus sp. L1K30]MBR0568714.1 glycerophosphodiester phosphodiesterase [Azoarcus sp. L1K30]